MNSYYCKKIDGNWLIDENFSNSFIAGNKYRKIEAILKDAGSIEGLVTIGSKYSSHILACAYWSRRMSIKMIGIIIDNKTIDINKYPNLLMAQKFGAKLLFTQKNVAFEFIEEIKNKYNEYLWIPGGGHLISAANAYENLFLKIFYENKQLREVCSILLPFGTGTTALGILNAIDKMSLDITVVGVSVSRPKKKCLESLYELQSNISEEKLEIIDWFAGRYDERSIETENSRWLFFNDTGVLLDPIYNAKSVHVFYERELKKCLILNTGGMLNNLL